MSINKKHKCGICEEQKQEGIYIYRLFICAACERNMIHTEPREEKYQYYLEKLKNVHQPSSVS